MPAEPQDRKQKKVPFKFTVEGVKYSLPSPNVDALPGRYLRDAALGGDDAQLAYMFKLLEVSAPEPASLEALYELPQTKMLDVLTRWGDHAQAGEVSVGESSRSSD